MSTLRFELPLKSAELKSMAVPIEVRDLKMRLVAETTSNKPIPVPDGKRYVVTARLPAGQTITEIVDADEPIVLVTLTPPHEGVLPDWQEVATYFASQRAQRAIVPKLVRPGFVRRMAKKMIGLGIRSIGSFVGVAAAPPPTSVDDVDLPRATLNFFHGNVLAGTAKPLIIDPQKKTSDALAELTTPPAGELQWVQCSYPDRTTINIALPVSPARGALIAIRREATRYWVEVHPKNPDANLLLGYAQNSLGDDEAKLAERLVFEKFEDPIAAAVGAYSLLRVSALFRLHEWTKKLMDFFPWLPDGAAIRGEHLARLGEHEKAFDAFVEVTKRGLPVFSDGVRFTYDRLRYYTDESSGLSGRHDQVREAMKHFRKFVNAIDFTKSVTTFAGRDPNEPKSTVVPPLPTGVNVASLFGSRI